MKLKLMLATAALSFFAAVSAHAALPITISLNQDTATTFSGSLLNTTGDSLFLSSDSVSPVTTLLDDTISDQIMDSFINTGGPLELAGNGSIPFQLTFNTATNLSDISLLVDGSVASPTGPEVVLGQFPTPSAVPEPGSVALLVGTTMGGGLLVARRRRK